MPVRDVSAFLGLLARALSSPGPNIDLYFKDRYVVVSKRFLAAITLLVLVILAAVFVGTFRLLQSSLH
jgi:hypothetical protein